MNHRICGKLGFLLVLIAAFCADEAGARKWTDSTGKFSIDAEFVEFVDGHVALRIADGREIRLPLERLSPADQQHVRALTASAAAPQAPAQAATPSAGEGATQTVIAEGVGASPDEALRDALRAAVNQVVGTVVDAETLVRNDQLIEDKILMYSNAFVKQYERISERDQGGLIRVRIRATVERRNLIARLKAENVTVTAVDGQSMFAEAITKIEERQGAEALLRKALEGFPGNCLTAEVVGKPKLLNQADDKATIQIKVEFRPDATACKAVGSRLQEILEKVAREKGDFIVTARQERPQDTIRKDIPVLFISAAWVYNMMPKVFPSNSSKMHQKGQFVVALNTGVSKLGDRTQWIYYCLDEGLKKPFLEAATQQTQCTISLLNCDAREVLADRFKIEPGYGAGFPITLLAVAPSPSGHGIYHLSTERDTRQTNVFLISRVFFQRNMNFSYVTAVMLTRDLQLSLEELKSVASIRCALEFLPSTLRTD